LYFLARDGVEKDKKSAVEWMEKAATKGHGTVLAIFI
jgi:TPR repeat protein